MKFALMNYHYLRYPIEKFLDKAADSPFDSVDLYCAAPQLNMFDYTLRSLIKLDKEISARKLYISCKLLHTGQDNERKQHPVLSKSG